MAQKKYVSLNRLSTFLDNLSSKFAALSHKHNLSDLTDYKIDTTLSSTSTNPVQNKVIDAEFEAIAAGMNALESAIDEKADASHSHDDRYYTESEIDTKLASKADSSHTHTIANLTNLQSSLDAKVPSSRTVNGKALTENISLSASDVGAAASSHVHDDRYYTESEIDTKLSSKSDSTHNHDSAYDAKGAASAVQTNLDTVSDSLDAHTEDTDIHVTTTNKSNWNTAYNHSQAAHARTDATKVADSTTNGNILINGAETNVYSHPNSGVTAGTYKSVTVNAQGHVTAGTNPTTLAGYGITDAESKGEASKALTSAKEYTDTVASGKADKTHNHDSAYDAKGSASDALASAKTYADSAATTAANTVKNDLLNGAGTAYDTLKELGDLIVDNADAIDALETVASGKADKEHGHAIFEVSGLQSALDGKAASSHGTHVSYSTTAPVMDGTASVGTASTVARSDHKHPTDTSRAAKTDLDSHTGNTTVHITSTERSNWNAAKTHADSAHAPSNAEKNQNAFSNITVGSTTVAADSATDTVTFVGSNVTITPDATNDKITFAVADGSTSAKGLVQLTNSTSSTSTTTAATPSSVKSAYDLANTAKTNAATAQTKADSAYTLASGKAGSLSDLGVTATAAELNYVDGVTSNVQTQLDSKVPSSRTVNGKALTSNISLSASDVGAATSSHTHDDRYYTESEVNTKLNTKLDKLTYEWNKEYNAGGTAGYLLIGSFPMYDTNVTIDIDATTNTTYHGTVVIATQNVSTTSIGSARTITVYGDPTGAISDAIRVVWASGSRNYNVYFVPATWSKNLIHIRAIGQYMDTIDTTKICTQFTAGTAPATTSGLTVTNALKSQFADASHTHNYAASSHTHDDRYYTESEIDTKLNGKANSSHGNHVPTTQTANNAIFLRNDNTWQTVTPANIGAATSGHTHSAATQSANGFMSATDKKKLDGIASGANAYTHPTSSGNKHIPSGGSSGQILRWSADGTAAWGADNNTTYSAATQSAQGLMSAADKKKLDGIATGANNYTYTLPAATSSALGGVKVGSNITNSSGTISLTKANVTSALGYTPPSSVPTDYVKLAGTQTVSGQKTFTGGTIHNASIYMKNNVLINSYNTSGNAVGMMAVGSDNNLVIGSNSYPHSGDTIVRAPNGLVIIEDSNGTRITNGGLFLGEQDTSDCVGIHADEKSLYLDEGNGESLRWFKYAGSGYDYIFRSEGTSGKTALGSDSKRWYKLYAASACSTSSDEREKSDIMYMSDYPVPYSRNGNNGNAFEQFFDKLVPATYTLNIENTNDLHIGFIAQDVEKAADEVGLPIEELGFVQHSYWKDEETGEEKDRYALCYEEFIALNTYMIQKQNAQIKEQQEQINSLEERIAKLEEMIGK